MPITILVVDDNPDDREFVCRALSRIPDINTPVIEAADEASCLASLANGPPIDCTLLDYSMPGRDGLKVLENILNRDPLAPVVILTGQGDESIAVRALKLGAQDYLSKDSVSEKSLKRAISNAIERADMLREIRDQQENLQTFAHVLVHDLRAPLRAIQGAIEMLTEDLSAEVAGENAEMLGFVTQGAQRMDRLILALKAYTDLDGAKPKFETVDIQQQINDVSANLASVINTTGARVICESALPRLQGDPPQIAQLLQNIIANGIKYNRAAPPVIRISASETGDHWALHIADNGIGIPTEFCQRIFEPFKRLHSDGEFDGTGLGLATSKKIVERHGGQLTCHSEPDRGTTFTVTLPKSVQ